MNFKSLIVTASAFLLTTLALYLIGNVFTISWLMFHFQMTNSPIGFSIDAGSFTPLILGLIASFFAENIYIHKTPTKP